MAIMDKNLFAYTVPTGYKQYPAYISVNESPDGQVAVTVRSPEEDGGGQSRIVLPTEEWLRMLAAFELLLLAGAEPRTDERAGHGAYAARMRKPFAARPTPSTARATLVTP